MRNLLPRSRTVRTSWRNARRAEARTADAALGACVDDESHADRYLADGAAFERLTRKQGNCCGALEQRANHTAESTASLRPRRSLLQSCSRCLALLFRCADGILSTATCCYSCSCQSPLTPGRRSRGEIASASGTRFCCRAATGPLEAYCRQTIDTPCASTQYTYPNVSQRCNPDISRCGSRVHLARLPPPPLSRSVLSELPLMLLWILRTRGRAQQPCRQWTAGIMASPQPPGDPNRPPGGGGIPGPALGGKADPSASASGSGSGGASGSGAPQQVRSMSDDCAIGEQFCSCPTRHLTLHDLGLLLTQVVCPST